MEMAIAIHSAATHCLSLSYHHQVHGADSNGDRPTQATEDTETEYGPHPLLCLSDITRAQVYPLCQCATQRLKAQ